MERVLIVEDSQERIDSFLERLKSQSMGIKIDVTDKSAEAIKFLKENIYDYVFLDHDLGGLQNEWDEEDCGMVVVDYVVKNNVNSNAIFMIHSLNIVRSQVMENKLRDGGFDVTREPFLWEIM